MVEWLQMSVRYANVQWIMFYWKDLFMPLKPCKPQLGDCVELGCAYETFKSFHLPYEHHLVCFSHHVFFKVADFQNILENH